MDALNRECSRDGLESGKAIAAALDFAVGKSHAIRVASTVMRRSFCSDNEASHTKYGVDLSPSGF